MKVKSKLPIKPDGSSQVAVWDVDDGHPDGEVMVHGAGVYEVAETAGILGALRSEKIVRVDDAEVACNVAAPAKAKAAKPAPVDLPPAA